MSHSSWGVMGFVTCLVWFHRSTVNQSLVCMMQPASRAHHQRDYTERPVQLHRGGGV